MPTVRRCAGAGARVGCEASLMFADWNQLAEWLRRVEAIRLAA